MTIYALALCVTPDSKVHGTNMGPIWGWQDPGGPHVGPMIFAIWDYMGSLGTELIERQIFQNIYFWSYSFNLYQTNLSWLNQFNVFLCTDTFIMKTSLSFFLFIDAQVCNHASIPLCFELQICIVFWKLSRQRAKQTFTPAFVMLPFVPSLQISILTFQNKW